MYIDRQKILTQSLNLSDGYSNAPWISVTRSTAQKAWRVIAVYHLSPNENGNNHHLYVDLVGENNLIVDRPDNLNLELAWSWDGRRQHEQAKPVKFDKSGDEPRANLPIFRDTHVEAWIGDSRYPSDVISNVHTDPFGEEQSPDQSQGNSRHHNSVYILWQLQDNAKEVKPVEPLKHDGKLYVEVDGVVAMLEALRVTMEAYLRGLGRLTESNVLNNYFQEAKERFKK